MAKRRKPNRNPDHGKGLLKRLAGRPKAVQTQVNQPPEVYHLMELEVTWDAMPDPAVDALPEATRDRMAELFDGVHQKPKSVIAELRQLAARHPEVPCFTNWLINSLRAGSKADQEEALRLCEQLFRDAPDYFFARTTLADIRLDKVEAEKAAGLLCVPGHSISTLYPGRKVFHISEIRHWAYLSARAKILLGEPEIAEAYRDMLEELEPESAAVRDLNSMLDGEKSDIMRMLASLRKLSRDAEQLEERRVKKSSAKQLKKSASESSARPASHPDQLDLF